MIRSAAVNKTGSFLSLICNQMPSYICADEKAIDSGDNMTIDIYLSEKHTHGHALHLFCLPHHLTSAP